VEELVGRSVELEALQRVLTSNGPRSIVVNGPVGVGKTRLLHEIAEMATRRGWMVLRLYGSRPLSSVPLGVVSHLVRGAPGGDPGQVFHAALGRLRSEAGDSEMLLVVDDCHDLDEGSAAFIHQLVVHGDAKSVLAKRSESPPPEFVAAMWADGTGEIIDLSPLDRPSSDLYVHHSLGGVVDPALLDEVYRISLGNPLFLVNCLRAGRAARSVVFEGGAWRMVGPLIAGHLHDLVLSRARDLPSHLVRALALVAVGGPLPVGLFERTAPAEALSALMERGLVTVTAFEQPTVAAAHPLYAEVFAGQLTPKQRREILVQLAESWLGVAVDDHSAKLQAALWLLEAGENFDHDLALTAAGEAMIRFDYALAERLATVALEAKPESVPAAVALGKAVGFQSRGEEALRLLEKVVSDVPDEFVEVAVTQGHTMAFLLGRPAAAADLMNEAAQRVDGGSRARLDAERALYMAMAGDFRTVFEAANSVLDNPDAPEVTRLAALVNYSLALAMTGLLAGLEEVVETGTALAREHPAEMPFAAHQIGLAQVSGLSASGRIAEAQLLAESAVKGADAAGAPNALWLVWAGYVQGLRGFFELAIESQTRALQLFQATDPFRLKAQSTGILAMHQAQSGRLSPDAHMDLERATVEAGNETRLSVWVERGCSWVESLYGDLEAASSMARSNGANAVEHDHIAWGVEALHDAVRFGHPALVRHDIEGAVSGTAGAGLLEAMRDHAVSLEGGDTEGLAAVSARLGRYGSPILAAEAWAQLARILVDRGSVVAAQRATLKSQLWHARCPSAQTPALKARPKGFSPRKLTVIEHAARGLTSREIAERLFVSPRTVDNHLRGIYQVLEISGRHQLADLVAGPLRSDSLAVSD
jgi:DNA-binding CsgD family transcriptional regulator/tetratricopeptide (TPR) repeat protein